MAVLVSVEEFRAWAGVNVPAQVPDALIQACLDEAEAGVISEVGAPIGDITADILATAEATGEVQRRAQNLLAKRNSPEGVAGVGDEGFITIPAIPAGGQRTIWHIREHLQVDEGVASDITEARHELADVITSAGIDCTPYPPDSTVAPAAWVEGVTVDYTTTGWSFCGQGFATARIIAVAPRNDKAGGLQLLEDTSGQVSTALEALPRGVQVLTAESGDMKVNDQTLPGFVWAVRFMTTDQ